MIEKFVLRLISKTKSDLDDKIYKAIRKPLYWCVIFIAMIICLNIWGNRLLTMNLIVVIRKIFFVFGCLLAGWFLSSFLCVLIEWSLSKTKAGIDKKFLPLFDRITKIFIWVLVLIITLNYFGININALVATLGVTSLAIALAFQDTIANIIAGFLIMLDRPFNIGDIVHLPSGEIGQVTTIGLRRTKFITLNNTIIIVPNLDLSKSKIVNLSISGANYPCRFSINISKEMSLEEIENVIKEVVKSLDIKTEPVINLVNSTNTTFELSVLIYLSNYMDKLFIEDKLHRVLEEKLTNKGLTYTIGRLV